MIDWNAIITQVLAILVPLGAVLSPIILFWMKTRADAAALKAEKAAAGIAKQLDGQLTKFFADNDEFKAEMRKQIAEAYQRGSAEGKVEAVNGAVGKVAAKVVEIKDQLNEQDRTSNERHEKNGGDGPKDAGGNPYRRREGE